MLSPRLRRVCTLAATLVALPASTPAAHAAEVGDDWFGRDKALHFGASAGLALGGYGLAAHLTDKEPPRWWAGGGLALGAGIGKEVADHFTGGDPSWRDLSWDVLGTATGLVIGLAIARLWPGPRPDVAAALRPLPRTTALARELPVLTLGDREFCGTWLCPAGQIRPQR